MEEEPSDRGRERGLIPTAAAFFERRIAAHLEREDFTWCGPPGDRSDDSGVAV